MKYRPIHAATAPRGLLIFSSREILQFDEIQDPKPILIRITSDFEFPALPNPDLFQDIQQHHFGDVCYGEKSALSAYDLPPMKRKHAARIAAFWRIYPEANFIVHCDAGFSRSAAVGLAWARYWRKDTILANIIQASREVHPNDLVLDRLKDAVQAVPVIISDPAPPTEESQDEDRCK